MDCFTYELIADGTMAENRKVNIRSADMSPEMQDSAAQIAVLAVSKFEVEKDMAAFVKKEFDRRYEATWHCIVGKHFGSYVTHEKDAFIYLYATESKISTRKITMGEDKLVIKYVDMPIDMQKNVFEITQKALERCALEKDIAGFIKKAFDDKYGKNWQCITGKHFGSFVTHEKDRFIYFYIGNIAFLLFKTA
ncbi:unnamed protein product [Schistocephalus solidus]|uniref:Dynein light chain 1, cytoplasmic n=1 Tax=Schistocephalus solidus TaxID=70667 RepID=A0A183TGC8_SCHSO|nr:unnamed protein product [Schistocephalus solidus]